MELDHPNIVKIYQCVYDNKYINIVMELVDGIPLSDYMMSKKEKRIPEEECQILLFQIMCAIKYFHSKGIVHRDLKLENIMVLGTESGNPQDLMIKVIDFGMSKLSQSNKKINLSTYCGTIDFIAPEVFEGKFYDQSCDLWSIGVIAYFMLSGMPPFLGQNDIEIEQKIITCNYDYDNEVWQSISKQAQRWIGKMLELEPKDRMTADQAIHHVWIKSM